MGNPGGQLHPVLRELRFEESSHPHEDGDEWPTALHVLQHLLETQVITEEVVRSAHASLCRSSSSSSTSQPSSSSTSPPLDPVENDQEQLTSPHHPPNRPLSPQSQEKIQLKSSVAAADSKNETNTLAFRRRHVALRFYYDGGRYSGLAENVGQDYDQSIEKALFAALIRAHLVDSRDTSGYTRCGRTDRGVSAAGQVVSLQLKSAFSLDATWDQEGKRPVATEELPRNSHDTLQVWVLPRPKKLKRKKDSNQSGSSDLLLNGENDPAPRRQLRSLSEYAYDKILNNLLPEDIRILGWTTVSADFSARFSASHRTYRYFFVRRHMCLDRMTQACTHLVGSHDFRNLCRMDVEKVYNFVRKIHAADIVMLPHQGDSIEDQVGYIQIVGQAFLWHQIRCIASILFLIGRGLEDPDIMAELLNVEKHPGKPSYAMAEDRPLVLHDCGFPHVTFGYSTHNMWTVLVQLEKQWEDFTLAAARVRNCINSLREATVVVPDLMEFCQSKWRDRAKKSRKIDPSLPLEEFPLPTPSEPFISWREALDMMRPLGLIPDHSQITIKEGSYTPLLQRSKGTTYEEKVASLQASSKRLQKYKENVIKKRKTKEEDAAFYDHMTRQGGSSI